MSEGIELTGTEGKSLSLEPRGEERDNVTETAEELRTAERPKPRTGCGPVMEKGRSQPRHCRERGPRPSLARPLEPRGRGKTLLAEKRRQITFKGAKISLPLFQQELETCLRWS